MSHRKVQNELEVQGNQWQKDGPCPQPQLSSLGTTVSAATAIYLQGKHYATILG